MDSTEKKPLSQRGTDFFGSDKFAWCLLGPGFAFVIGLAIYGMLSDLPAAFEAIKAIIW